MGRLLEGEWHTDSEQIQHDDGEFNRTETSFRDWIKADEDAQFTPEAGRYHLYVSRACPWAHRTLITRSLLGLEEAITVDVVDPLRIDDGWEFTPGKDGCTADSIHDRSYLRDVYTAAESAYTGRVTVPVLWDREHETIVNNESEEIIKMFDTAFRSRSSREARLYPPDQQAEIDQVIDDIYPSINNGVYRAGFAGTQAAYDTAVKDLFEALSTYNSVLADQRYLVGNTLTLADVCMFTTLIRFDEVYQTHFNCNHRRITEYDQLWGYLRDIYQTPGVAETTNMAHIKEHYYRSHTDLNPSQLIPIGPEPDFDAPYDRGRFE